MLYYTKSRGIGGRLKSPEDFVVREVMNPRFLRKYAVGKTVSRPGKYVLVLIKKRNLATKEAIKKLSRKLDIPAHSWGYAGLKDKFSVSYQYLTVKTNKELEKANFDNLEILEVRKTDNFLSKGDLTGNEFTITLHGCTGDPAETVSEISKGIPNFFGPQRFGKHGNNHIIGRLFLQRKFPEALKIIGKNSVKDIKKDVLKFYIHAYQSHVFNSALNEYARKNRKPLFSKVRIPGYKTDLRNNKIELLMKNILEKDKIKSGNFIFNDLRMSVAGAERHAFIKADIKYEKNGDNVKLYFALPKGSYATTVIREISKS